MAKSARPKRCWQRTADATPPSWIDFDLDEQSVELGSWVVMHNRGKPHPHHVLLTNEQFEETYR